METMVVGMSRCADDDVFLDGAAEENEEVEELVEPRFRYKRILGDLTRLMESEVASCFAIHEKLLVVGFQSGRICIFDHLGNVNIDSCARNHKCAVTCVAIDDPANYIVSCANDFSIVIFGIGCAEYNQRLSLKTSAKIVAISPDFSRLGSGQRFLAGAQDLVLYERGVRAEFFSGRRRETLLFRGTEKDGLVSAISWHNSLVAFSNESGTRVYDMKSARCVTLIQPVHKIEQFPTAKFPPKLFWLNQQCLAIGWANTLCVCGIVESTERRLSSASTGLFEAPKKYGQILHRFVLPNFAIAGVSFTTRSSYGTEYPLFPPAAISSPPSAANLPTQAQTLKNGMPTLSPPNTDNQLWRELILFGLKCGSIREPSLLGSSNPDQQKNAQTAADHQNVSLADQLSTVSNFCCSNADACSAQLLLIRPLSLQEYSIEAEDSIEMRNVNLKLLHRFSLCSLPMDDIYFILSPREAIEARPCSIDNRIKWLMENGLFEEALDSAIRNADSLRENSVLEVGKRLISHLIERQDFETAAGYLPDVCAKRKEEWMFYVSEFEKQHQVLKLVPVLPTREPQLEPENYESILIAALHSRPKLFHALVTHWDSDIYRAGSILSEVFKRITEDNANKQRPTMGKQKDSEVGTNVLSEQNRVYLLRALASLLLQCRKYDDAIKTYLLIRDQAIFGVIERHKLFPYVKEQIMELMEINQDLAIRLLLDNEDLISHEKVVNLLGNHPRIQLAYLHRLQARGEGSQYADRLVKLYAEHDRASLLPFLRKNEYYRLDLALKTCKKRDFIEEVVYLLGRSGNRLDALDLMVNKMLRIDLAIDFCVENDDPELWERLVESAIKHPEQIAILLSRMASTNIDSLSVVEKIPLQMDIPNLQKCLLQVLLDHEQQRDLLKYSKSVAASDVIGLLKSQLKPMAIIVVDAMGTIIGGQSDDGQQMKCAACHTNLVSASRNDFFLMKDGNMLHQRCYESYNGVNKPSTSTTTYRTKSTESWE